MLLLFADIFGCIYQKDRKSLPNKVKIHLEDGLIVLLQNEEIDEEDIPENSYPILEFSIHIS